MTAPDVSPVAGLRVLVVEDEYMIAEHISILLEDLGCDVAGPVATIDDALSILKSGKLDGALLDANLNGVGTGPIAAALNEASVPFIVATGYGSRDLGDNALNLAPRINKPFGKIELRATLLSALAR